VFRATRRREQAGIRPAEGIAPYVIAALGGSALMLLWLKLGSLIGIRDVAASQFKWSYLVVGAIAGALLALVAQMIWGYVGAIVVRSVGGHTTARDLRVVWGASDSPHVVGLVVLLPFDLIVVGTDTFTSEKLTDPLSTGWAALSIAFSLSLAIWSLFIFVRGVEVAADVSWIKALAISFVGLLVLAVIVAGSVVGAAALAGGA
jgi:Yip1 domain